jgi:hypothetical protein
MSSSKSLATLKQWLLDSRLPSNKYISLKPVVASGTSHSHPGTIFADLTEPDEFDRERCHRLVTPNGDTFRPDLAIYHQGSITAAFVLLGADDPLPQIQERAGRVSISQPLTVYGIRIPWILEKSEQKEKPEALETTTLFYHTGASSPERTPKTTVAVSVA